MTIKEIAQLAGVSISTVSKIVNNKDANINAETRRRVLQIVKDYNYTPYGSAKDSSEARTFILGVLLKSSPKTNRFLSGIMTIAQQNGYRVLLYDSMDDPEQELKNITSVCKSNADGVIWETVSEDSLRHRRYFDEHKIEVCCVSQDTRQDAYSVDFAQLGYQAAKILIEYGHTRLGCLTKPDSHRSALILEGFKKCLFDHEIPYHDSMNLNIEEKGWKTGIFSHNPTGIVSSHYALSMSLMKHLEHIRFHVPYDMSIISLRDDVRENITFPGISSIKIPYYEFGVFLCERLIEKCEKRSGEDRPFRMDCAVENTMSLDIPYTSRAKRIVVVGSINIDVTLNVDELPQPGKTISTGRYSISPGGKGANQAIGAARLGNDVSLIGKVGSDFDATLVYTSMEENHVDIRGIQREPFTETGKAYIHVKNDGESMITILSGANHKLTPSDIFSYERLFDNAGYCLLQTEVPTEVIEAAAGLARRHGVKTILKPAALGYLSDSLIENIDIFVPNRKEAEILCPEIPDIEGKAKWFRRRGAGAVIITLGAAGCYVMAPEYTGYLPAAEFTPVDTTGAADAFIAALAVYLSAGYPLRSAAVIASYAAGFCISRQGVISALIDRNSLEAYIKKIEPGLIL